MKEERIFQPGREGKLDRAHCRCDSSGKFLAREWLSGPSHFLSAVFTVRGDTFTVFVDLFRPAELV